MLLLQLEEGVMHEFIILFKQEEIRKDYYYKQTQSNILLMNLHSMELC